MQICCKEIFVVSNLHTREVKHHTYQKWNSCQLKICFRIRKGWKFFLKRYTLYFYFYYTSVHVTTFSGSNFYSRTNYCWSSQANEAMALWIRKKVHVETHTLSHPPGIENSKGKTEPNETSLKVPKWCRQTQEDYRHIHNAFLSSVNRGVLMCVPIWYKSLCRLGSLVRETWKMLEEIDC